MGVDAETAGLDIAGLDIDRLDNDGRIFRATS